MGSLSIMIIFNHHNDQKGKLADTAKWKYVSLVLLIKKEKQQIFCQMEICEGEAGGQVERRR